MNNTTPTIRHRLFGVCTCITTIDQT